MSREAWGDPPDPEPKFCPNCGQEKHTPGCEVCELDIRRITAQHEAMRLRCAAKMALEDLEQATSFSTKRARDRNAKTIAALRSALMPNTEGKRP